MIKKKGKVSASSKKKMGTSKKGSFHYKERDPDAIKRRAEQKGGRYDSIFKSNLDSFRFKEGDNALRFLPPTWTDPEPDHYGYDIWVHRNVGADNSTYLCLNKMKGKSCPVCNAVKEARDSGEEDDAKALQASKRIVAWVVDRDADTPRPLLIDMSWTMDRDIAALCYDKRKGTSLQIDNDNMGYDVTVRRQGKGLNTRYFGMVIDREPSPISEDEEVQAEILEYIAANPIPDTLNFFDVKYLERQLSGSGGEKDEDLDDEDEDEDETDESESESEEEDDDDSEEEDDDDESEDEEEDESDDDNDEEEEDESDEEEEEEDDEEEEAPARSRIKPKPKPKAKPAKKVRRK